MDKLREKLKNLPKKPGVYQFLNKSGEVIYIGKAKNLKTRVGQYFSGRDNRNQIPYLMRDATDVDYTVVSSELESLYLENTLIKKYLPKYNIMLRDDKNYAFIKIDYSTQIPQIQVVRKISAEGGSASGGDSTTYNLQPNTYFGPYSAAYKIRSTLNLTRKIFPYCSAQKVGVRPCFYYYLRRCLGVCVGKISLDEYKRQMDLISHFLAGNTGKIKKELQAEMKLAAGERQFEKAARLRDQLSSLRLLEEKQIAILTKKVDWDIVSLAQDQGCACVNLFKVRDGKLFDKENFVYEAGTDVGAAIGRPKNGKPLASPTLDSEITQKFLEQYYLETSSIPQAIYTQIPGVDPELIERVVKSRFNRNTKIISPQKGKALRLVKLGAANAQEYLKSWLASQAGHMDKINSALAQLKEILKLDKIPERIEGFDISNIQGANAVGSMVVFEKGLPKKSEYRKFKIRSRIVSAEDLPKADDFAMMKEMLARRFSHSVIARSASDEAILSKDGLPRPSDALGARNDKGIWPIPDLIVIDGGKGQLNAALAALRISNSQFLISKQIPKTKNQKNGQYINIPMIGLAKRLEEIYLPQKKAPIILPHDQPALQLLQKLRDEAHRFGITFHRKLRSKQAVRSALDDIPGIGPKTKKLLKAKFGAVSNIRKASFDELAGVVGEKIARLIQQSL